ncbi:hypothetical protein G6F40_015967 [Rhizopus arrhizus]|nr:hypothetical protein G6F40_015967 [Rhizopus arrhizus]
MSELPAHADAGQPFLAKTHGTDRRPPALAGDQVLLVEQVVDEAVDFQRPVGPARAQVDDLVGGQRKALFDVGGAPSPCAGASACTPRLAVSFGTFGTRLPDCAPVALPAGTDASSAWV